MSTKAERGTKRTCQNPECGSRFYDLNRDPIVCPICETVFQLNAEPADAVAGALSARQGPATRTAAKKSEELPVADADEDALPAIEGEDDPAPAEEDEPFLEPEEEDGADMTNIIGGPVAEPDEPQ